MAPNIEVIVGTYEEFLIGYKLENKNGKEVLTQSFADKSHSGALKCIAVQGHWVATGATDDRIFIYDMRTRKQSQIILSHEGTINALAFTPDVTHLLSGATDGQMIVTRLNTWFAEAKWKKAHSGSAVTHISCHPSGKLALSLGMDFVLRTWNLVKGRVAYQKNLKSRSSLGCAPDCLAWSPGGEYFSLSGQRVIEIWSIKTADVVRSQKTNSKPISVCWISDEACLVGLEDGKILWVTVTGEEEEILSEAHNSRVKAMFFSKGTLVTAASSGEIKIFEVNESKRNLKELAATNIGCRPTCIGILDLEQFGDNYVVSNVSAATLKESQKPKKKSKQQRGIVTIEYENADGEDLSNNHEDDNDSESESEEDSDDESKEDIDDEHDEDDSDDVEDNSDDGEENSDDVEEDEANEIDSSNDDDTDEEAPQPAPIKSTKRKHNIIKINNTKITKKSKFNEGNEKLRGKIQKTTTVQLQQLSGRKKKPRNKLKK